MTQDDDAEFWADRFHHCALVAGFLAAGAGRLADSRYVQRPAYRLYEGGTHAPLASSLLTGREDCATPPRKSTEEKTHAPQEENDID